MSGGQQGRILALLHGGFVLAGMATTVLGPMMPLLMTQWALTDAAAGTLFTAQFTGQTLSTFGSSLVTRRLGDRRTLALGAMVAAGGLAVLPFAAWPMGAAAAFAYGTGLGLVLPITNFVVASLRPRDAAGALSLLNVSWGVGAVVWPLVVGLTLMVTPGSHAPMLLLSGAMALLGGALLGAGTVWPDGPRAAAVAGTGGGPPPRFGVAGLAALFAALSYLYVGTEASIGGWIAEFTRRTGQGASGAWAYAPTAFWGAETLGRLGAPLVLRRVSEDRLTVAGLCTAGAAVLLLVAGSGGASMAIVGAIVAGIGLAPVFPLVLASMTRHVAPVAPGLMGPLFAMGGLGGATLPWMVGLVSTTSGRLQAGLLVPLGALALMLALHATGRRR